MNFTLVALLISLSILANHSNAQPSVNYFDSQESSRYTNDQGPKNNNLNNRFDSEPILTISKFDLSSLPDLSSYGIHLSDLETICQDSIKDNNGRYTISRFNRLTMTLTKHLREKGLLLAKIYIPEQDVSNKTVKLRIAEGIVQSIASEQMKKTKNSSELYQNDTLVRPFKSLLGKPSYRSQLESSMIRLSQYPGLETQVQFRPSKDAGATELNIKVKNQNKFEGSLTFDNFGSEYTGNYRVNAKGNINNITGNADQLSLGIMATLDPTNSLYGSLDYQIPIELHISRDSLFAFLNPIFTHGLVFQTGLQQSTYSIGRELEALNIKGEATTNYYSIKKPWVLTNSLLFDSSLRVDLKSATSQQNNADTEDKLTILSFNNSIHFIDHIYDVAQNNIKFDLHQGLESTLGSMANGDSNSRLNQNSEYAPADFKKISFEFSRLQQVDSFQILTKFNYQYTEDTLLGLEQVSLGGPYAVRGYTSSDYIADTAFQSTIEVIGKSYAEKLSLPIDNLTAALFFDYAIGWRNDALANEDATEHLYAIGWYADFVKEKKFQTRMQMGFPLSKTEPVNGNSVQFYLSAQRRF